MYPFYKKSVKDGMTGEAAKKILHNLYELLNSYADGACLLNAYIAPYLYIRIPFGVISKL